MFSGSINLMQTYALNGLHFCMIFKRINISTRLEFDLHLFNPGLSTRNLVKAMSFLVKVKKSHGASWKWIQKHNPQEK